MLVDSHCHLADPAFGPDLDQVIARAQGAGVGRVLIIVEAENEQEADQARRAQTLWADVNLSIGMHPHGAHQFADDPLRVEQVVRRQLASTPSACAVGEVGLDYHYDFSPRSVQQAVFGAQVRLARELDKPLVVHTREADADTLSILRGEGQGGVRGVLHCFTGGASLAEAALDLGFYISFAGIVTFPRAGELRETARLVPLDRLLIETDSPFLAPVPHRGKRNEPAFVVRVAETLAALRRMDVEELGARTTANFHRLFRP